MYVSTGANNDNHLCCSEVGSAANETPLAGFVAMCERGECPFHEKYVVLVTLFRVAPVT
jgi:hypothetical protein